MVVPSVGLTSKGQETFNNPMLNSQEAKTLITEKKHVCEGIQKKIKNFQHRVGKMSIIESTKSKVKSTFFVDTPPGFSMSKLNFNVKNPKKALIEKILEPGDSLLQTIQLEGQWIRKLCIVCHGSEFCLIGTDFFNNEDEPPTIGLVVKILWDTKVDLDGDGGFSVCQRQQHYIFKPVSVQALWTIIQTLSMISEKQMPKRNSLEINANDWVNKYVKKIGSNQTCINEWHFMADILVRRPVSPERGGINSQDSLEQLIRGKLREIMKLVDLDTMTSKAIRSQLEKDMDRNLETYKSFIDKEILVILGQMDPASRIEDYLYLGSEWNASNLDELRQNNITHILNVTREIDNFFPGNFKYMNVRVYDEETTDLLKYFNSTYNFIKDAKNNSGNVLVHCKMGISRSASVTISFMMKEHQWSLEKAMFKVKKARSIVVPNKSFLKQLSVYEGILGAARHRQIYQGLFRSKSESSLVPRDDADGPVGHGKKPRRKHRKVTGNDPVTSSNQKTAPVSTPARPISEPWGPDEVWRPKSWSPNERTAQILMDDRFDLEEEEFDSKTVRCRCFDHFKQPCDNQSSSEEDNKTGATESSQGGHKFSYTSLGNRLNAAPPVSSEACNCDQMEYELCVPSSPVSVSQTKSDPATDAIVQSLSNIPLQARTKLCGQYSSSSSTSSFSSSVPSTPIFAPKRQTSTTETESSETDKEEVLSVKTLANMFDFKSGTNHIPPFKPGIAKLEEHKIYQRAAKLCEGLDQNTNQDQQQPIEQAVVEELIET